MLQHTPVHQFNWLVGFELNTAKVSMLLAPYITLLTKGHIAQWAKLANLGSVLISVKNIFIKSQKYFGGFIIYFLKNILVK